MEATPATLLKTAGDAVDAVLEFAESRRRELLPVSVVLFAVGFYADYADIVRPGVSLRSGVYGRRGAGARGAGVHRRLPKDVQVCQFRHRSDVCSLSRG